MSGSLTFTAGQVFTGAASVGSGDTGQLALTEVGNVAFTATTPPAISQVTITQDKLGSNFEFDSLNIESVSVTAVHTDAAITLSAADLPPGTSLPPGFTLPQTVVGTVLDVTVQTNSPFVTGTARLAVIGTTGNLALVGVQNLLVDGVPANLGAAAILSFGSQTAGAVDDSFAPSFSAAPCFAAGTRIATPRGEVAVQDLRAGDLVSLADGGTAPVVWLGHRRVDCSRHPTPRDVLPVRIASGAVAEGMPARDLLLSPDHAVFTDGVLIPVRYLVNGRTVAPVAVATIDYLHVELDRHGVLFAEDLAAESFLDTGNRGAFANGSGAIALHADFARRIWQAEGYADLVLAGDRLAAVRRRLLERAATLGHRITASPDLTLLTDGRRLEAAASGADWRVRIPRGAAELAIRSRTWIPAQTDPDATDPRQLGVAIAQLMLDGRPVALTSPGMRDGWHTPEPPWRWTDGAARLDVGGIDEIRFSVVMTGRYWRSQERTTVGRRRLLV